MRKQALSILFRFMKIKVSTFGAAALAAVSPAQAQDFSCRNATAEIRCGDGECRVETDSFTPMQLSRVGPLITLCAYSGCWEGKIVFSRSRSGVLFLQARMGRDRAAGEAEETLLSVMLSRGDRAAQINWSGFFSVMECAGGEG